MQQKNKTGWFRRFVSYYKPYKGLFAADMICAVLAAVVSLWIPLCVRHITKDILEGGTAGMTGAICRTGAVMVALVLLQALCTYVYDAWGHTMGAMMERDMRKELFDHYQRLSFRFHDSQRPGVLLSRLTNDLLQLTELYHHGPEDLVIYLVKFMGAFAILFTINMRLAGIIFLFLPPMALFTLFFSRRLRRAFRKNLEVIGGVNGRVEENLSGIRVVKAFGNETLEAERFQEENNRFLSSRKAIYHNESYFYVGISAMTQLVTVAVVVFGGIAITTSSLDLADLLTFLLYVGYLVEPIPKLAHIVQQYQEGFTGFERFLEIMHTQPDITEKPGAKAPAKVEGDISLENVSFRYHDDREPVLTGVSLHIRPGEHIALVGPSGVGKSTLCSLIPRFYDVSGGRVALDGADIRELPLQALRDNIGVVQQDMYLFSGTIYENILFGCPGASREKVVEAARLAGAHSFIEELPEGYRTQIGHRGIKLSAGQKQRLSIARVFLKNPPVLILDEATSALDSENELLVQQSLERLSQGRTTIVIAHRLATIRNADRIVVLSGKGIAEEGSHQELLEQGGVYARMHRLQTR